MQNSSENLSKNMPRVFEPGTAGDIKDAPVDIKSSLSDAIKQDIDNFVGNSVASVETDLLYKEFVEDLKTFLDDTDSVNAKSESDDKLTTIESQVEGLTLDNEKLKDAIKNVSKDNITNLDKAKIDLEVKPEFIEKISKNILGVINFNNVISSTLENMTLTIKSIMDANAEEFKNVLNEEMNSNLGINDLKNAGEEQLDKNLIPTKDKESEGEEDIDSEPQEESGDLENAESELENTTAEIDSAEQSASIEEKQQAEQDKKDEADAIKDLDKQNANKNKQDDSSATANLEAKQRKLDLQRKKKMLEIDHKLDDTNKHLRKLIESQDVVEEYNSDSEDKIPNEVSDEKPNESIQPTEESTSSKGIFGKKLGIGLAIGALITALIVFRGYTRQADMQAYIEKHKRDKDDKAANRELNSELSSGKKENEYVETEFSKVESAVDDILPKVDEVNETEQLSDDEGDKEPEVPNNEANPEIEQPAEEQEAIPSEDEGPRELPEELTELENLEIPEINIPEIPKDIQTESEESPKDSEINPEDINKDVNDIAETSNEPEVPDEKSIKDSVKSAAKAASSKNNPKDSIEKSKKKLQEINEQLDKNNTGLEEEHSSMEETYSKTKELDEKMDGERGKRESNLDEEQKRSEEASKNFNNDANQNNTKTDEDAKAASDQIDKTANSAKEKDEELTKNSAPKSAVDDANKNAVENQNDAKKNAEETNKDLDTASNESANNAKAIEQSESNSQNTIDSDTESTVEEVSEESTDADTSSDKLEEKTEKVDENVAKLEESSEQAEEESKDNVDKAAAESIEIPTITEEHFVDLASKDLDKIFSELNTDNQKNDNYVMINKNSLNAFYAQLRVLRNSIASVLIAHSNSDDNEVIKNQIMQMSMNKM